MATNPIMPVRAANLALIFQEVLTVIERFRAGRLRIDTSDLFRSQIRNAIESAERDGLRRGYSQEDVRLAKFAVVAFLDESILNSKSPVFAAWQAKPLQQDLFGVFEAGEIIFRNIDRLLGRPDSEPLADVLEVHQLIMLLGFRGRHSAGGTPAEIRSILRNIEERIRRIRGVPPALAWQPPVQARAEAVDPWIPALKWTALGCAAMALMLFVIFKFSLMAAISELGSIASQIFS